MRRQPRDFPPIETSPMAKAATRKKSVSKSATKSAPKLGQLPVWDLKDLYPGLDSPEVQRDLARADSECLSFEQAFKGRLEAMAAGPGAGQALAEAVRRYDALDDLLGRLISYASLFYAGNNADPAGAKFYGDMQDRVEELFHEKSVTGYSAWNRQFDETVAGLRFKVGGKPLSIEPALNLLQDADGKKRKEAAQALAKTFKENLRPFTLITNTLAKDKEISDRWRGFKDVADARHLSNRVEPEVVEALVSAVHAAYPKLSHRYYALKAKWFGKKTLAYWDRNAPLPKVAQPTIPWSDARATVLTAYGAFSPKMAEVANRFFTNNWIDAALRDGKQPGAFAHPTVPSAHPYVLLNYQGKPRDVMTLAHELGHGVHQVLAAPNGPLMAPTPLTLAETASVFGEMLTFKKLLAQTTDKKQRKAMLAAKVEDMINTVVRQIAFYSFERKVHLERRNGELTSDKICELWMSVQSESLGPAIELKAGYETFWSYIPHFIHAPFYVYAYAFGDCLVNSLYAVYEKSASGFAERYLVMLAAGGTKHHTELLAPFGLDARDPKFWDGGLSVIANLIGEIEALDAGV